MSRPLVIGSVSFVLLALGGWGLAGLGPGAALGVAAAFGLLTMLAVSASGGTSRRRLGVSMLALGLFLIGCGALGWFWAEARAASVVGLLSGALYAALGSFEMARGGRAER